MRQARSDVGDNIEILCLTYLKGVLYADAKIQLFSQSTTISIDFVFI